MRGTSEPDQRREKGLFSCERRKKKKENLVSNAIPWKNGVSATEQNRISVTFCRGFVMLVRKVSDAGYIDWTNNDVL